MAKRPAKTAAADVNEIPPAMDYAAHNSTYGLFTKMVKWTVIASIVTLVALYFFMVGQQPVVGVVLLLLLPVGAVAAVVTNSRRT